MIDKFIQHWKEKKTTPQYRMATAYEAAIGESRRLQAGMLSLIRPQSSSKGLIAIFDPQAESFMPAYEAAEKKATDVAADIEKYLDLTNGEPDINRLLAEKLKYQNGLRNAEHAVKSALARAMKNGAKTAADAESAKEVQEVTVKKETLDAEFSPKLKEVESSLKKINAILKKY